MRPVLSLKRSSPFDPAVSQMIDELDRHQGAWYPPESHYHDPRESLDVPSCCFLSAYRNGELVGIGAAKIIEDRGELKRFFVRDADRGQGIAECLVAALEKWLIENDITKSYLETGNRHHAALKFYEKLGYERTGRFGDYKSDPLSVFMMKDLSGSIIKDRSESFHIVAFSSRLVEPSEKYSAVADEMVQLAQEQVGFLGMHSTRDAIGRGFTASYWKNLESIAAWGKHPRHLEAQKLGKAEFYSSFKTTIAHVEKFLK